MRRVLYAIALCSLLLGAGVEAASVRSLWDPVTTREDGTPLTNLAGYRLYFGPSSRHYTASQEVDRSTLFLLSNLNDGQTYYIAATAYDTAGRVSKYSNEVVVTAAAGPGPLWVVPTFVSVDSEESIVPPGNIGLNVVDGQSATFWHTKFLGGSPPVPHTLIVKVPAGSQISGLSYLPRQDGTINGTISQYTISLSTDGVTWPSPVSTGTWASTTTEKIVTWTPTPGPFVRLRAIREVNGRPWTSAAEVKIQVTPAGITPIPTNQGAMQFIYTWMPGVNGQTGVRIERQADGGAWTILAPSMPATANRCTDRTVTPGHTYCYRSINLYPSSEAMAGAITCGAIP